MNATVHTDRGPAALFGHDAPSSRRQAHDAARAILAGAQRLPAARVAAPSPSSTSLRFAEQVALSSPTPNSDFSELGASNWPTSAKADVGRGEEVRAARRPAYDGAVVLAIAAVAAIGAALILAATLIHLGRTWGW